MKKHPEKKKRKPTTTHKNIIKGNISDVGSLNIGDVTHIHQNTPPIPKQLTQIIPTRAAKDIIGRQVDIQTIRQKLKQEQQVVLVNSMGGLGKTTLAQVYTKEYWENYAHIAWITLDINSTDVQLDFLATKGLLQAIGLENTQEANTEQLFGQVLQIWKSIPNSPCLLVLDNATSALSTIFHALPKPPNWHILATSREELPHFEIHPLGFLSPVEATALFYKHYQLKHLSNDFVQRLLQTLKYHTLSIEILAKTAQIQRTSEQDLIRALSIDLAAPVPTYHSQQEKIQHITTYICQIFDLSSLTAVEQQLLLYLSCLPKNFHRFGVLEEIFEKIDLTNYKEGFFRKFWNKIKIRFSRFKSLNIYNLSTLLHSLAKQGWLLYDNELDSYQLHAVIGKAVQKQLELNEEKVEDLIICIDDKLRIDQAKDNPVDSFFWISFGEALLELIEDSDSIGSLMNQLALVLRIFGNFQQAKSLLEKAVKINSRHFGETHPNTTTRYGNLALVLQDLGQFNKAKILLEKVIEIDEAHLEKDDSSLATSYSNLAIILQDLGQFDEALILLDKALKIDTIHFGENHPITSIRYSNIASVLQGLGQLDKALILLDKALKIDTIHFGENHPTTATSYSKLASIFEELGQFDKAKTLFEKTVKINKIHFGNQHLRTANSYFNLALVLQTLEQYQQALHYAQKTYQIRVQIFPPEHPNYQAVQEYLQQLKQVIKEQNHPQKPPIQQKKTVT